MKKNEIIEPDNLQGKFENALRQLQEKLTDFHCPICHAEEGISFIDEPYFVMHYDWDKQKDSPWGIQTSGHGKLSVLGICNNCGYSMMFNVEYLTAPYKLLTFTKETVHIRKVVELVGKKKKSESADK